MHSVVVDNISKIYTVSNKNENFKEFLRDGVVNFFSSGEKVETEFYALRDVSFALDKGDVLGIIGDNGAGKSTLLKIVSGVSQPSKGEVRHRGL